MSDADPETTTLNKKYSLPDVTQADDLYVNGRSRGRRQTPGDVDRHLRSRSVGDPVRKRSNNGLDDDDLPSDGIDESTYDMLTQSENDIENQRISQNYLFGFKKWKSHVTSRPLANRSEIVQDLYADISEVKPVTVSTLHPSNIFYVIMFGWWQALLYLIIGGLMFLTVIGRQYGFFCFRMAGYFIWPFGKYVYLVDTDLSTDFSYTYSGTESGYRSNISGSDNSSNSEETRLLLDKKETTMTTVCKGFWCRFQSYLWIPLGLPILLISHFIVMFVAWLLVVTVPVAKMNWRTFREILFLPPEQVKVGESSLKQTRRFKSRCEIIMYIHRAINGYYYKYTVDGMNIILVNLLVFVVLSVGLGYSDPDNKYYSGVLKCILGVLAIVPLTYYIGMAIISISAQSNFAVGAVLNATFGSVVEIIIFIIALQKGKSQGSQCYVELVKSSLTGAIIGSILFIPGICMVTGGIKYRSQRFNPKSANVTALLLFVAIGGVFAPTVFSKIFGDMQCTKCENVIVTRNGSLVLNGTNNSYSMHCTGCYSDLLGLDGDKSLFRQHIQPLVYTCVILLPIAYIIGMIFALKTHSKHIHDDFNKILVKNAEEHHGGHDHGTPQWSRLKSIVILLASATLIALCADLITENFESFLHSSGISEYFIGVTMIAMIPELPEVVNGIQFALQNNVNLGIEIGTSTAVQVCMIQVPILVLVNAIVPFGLEMVFNDIHLYSVIFAVVVINYTFQDGKSDYFQGTVLVFIYALLLCMYFFMPTPDRAKCY